MEKLEPVLKHHFWILALLVLPLGLWGYYSANSSLKAATAEREQALDGIFGNISDGRKPNENWEAEMKRIADQFETLVDEQVHALHEQQETLMTWPASLMAHVPSEYRGEWHNTHRFSYKRTGYPAELQALWERYEPVVSEDETPDWVTWRQKVIIDPSAIRPQHVFPGNEATNDQMWDAQEDIWLHRLIADAVVRTNQDADGVHNSVVRMVSLVELMGGDGKPVAGGTRGGQAGGASDDYEGQGLALQMSGIPVTGTGGGRGAQAGPRVSVSFEPSEEIGTGGRAGSSRGGVRGAGFDMSGMATIGGDEQSDAAAGRAGSTPTLRYVDFNENSKSRVRAFYMSVIINQSKFPEFLVELCNSPWPIKIVRFNFGENPYATSLAGRRPSTGGVGAMMEGYDLPGTGTGGLPGVGLGGGRGPMGSRGPMGGTRPGTTPGPMNPMGRTGVNPMSPMGGVGRPGQPQTRPGFGALDHPDLVQMDILGLITIFNPSTKPPASQTAAITPADEPALADDDMQTDLDDLPPLDDDGNMIPVPEPSEAPADDSGLAPSTDEEAMDLDAPTDEPSELPSIPAGTLETDPASDVETTDSSVDPEPAVPETVTSPDSETELPLEEPVLQ